MSREGEELNTQTRLQESATATSLGNGLNHAFVQTLLSLLSSDAVTPSGSSSIELCVIGCLSVIVQHVPSTAQAVLPALRRCISSVDLLTSDHVSTSASPLLVESVSLLMYCLESVNRRELTLSVLHSFLNHGQAARADIASSISGLESGDASLGGITDTTMSSAIGSQDSSTHSRKVLLKTQALQAAVMMTSRIASVETADLTVTTLLQRVRSGKKDDTEFVAIHGLGSIGHFASSGDFRDTLTLLVDVACKGTLSRNSETGHAVRSSYAA